MTNTKKGNLKMENQTPKYMRAKQLAKHFSISLPTIWLYLRQGKITSKKVSSSITLFEVAEIEKALFIHHKLVKAQRAEHSEMLREYIQDVLEGYYPSRTYKEKIEKTKGLDKLRAIRDMLGETTDWYVQMYIKDKRSKS